MQGNISTVGGGEYMRLSLFSTSLRVTDFMWTRISNEPGTDIQMSELNIWSREKFAHGKRRDENSWLDPLPIPL